MGRIAARFGRVEPRRRARAFVLGLLADLPRKNCWSIAEHAGDRSPGGMQHLLGRARWDADGVRDDLRDYITGQLGEARVLRGDLEGGDLFLEEAASADEEAFSPDTLAVAKCERSLVAMTRGDWNQAEALAGQAGTVLRRAGIEDSYATGEEAPTPPFIHPGVQGRDC